MLERVSSSNNSPTFNDHFPNFVNFRNNRFQGRFPAGRRRRARRRLQYSRCWQSLEPADLSNNSEAGVVFTAEIQWAECPVISQEASSSNIKSSQESFFPYYYETGYFSPPPPFNPFKVVCRCPVSSISSNSTPSVCNSTFYFDSDENDAGLMRNSNNSNNSDETEYGATEQPAVVIMEDIDLRAANLVSPNLVSPNLVSPNLVSAIEQHRKFRSISDRNKNVINSVENALSQLISIDLLDSGFDDPKPNDPAEVAGCSESSPCNSGLPSPINSDTSNQQDDHQFNSQASSQVNTSGPSLRLTFQSETIALGKRFAFPKTCQLTYPTEQSNEQSNGDDSQVERERSVVVIQDGCPTEHAWDFHIVSTETGTIKTGGINWGNRKESNKHSNHDMNSNHVPNSNHDPNSNHVPNSNNHDTISVEVNRLIFSFVVNASSQKSHILPTRSESRSGKVEMLTHDALINRIQLYCEMDLYEDVPPDINEMCSGVKNGAHLDHEHLDITTHYGRHRITTGNDDLQQQQGVMMKDHDDSATESLEREDQIVELLSSLETTTDQNELQAKEGQRNDTQFGVDTTEVAVEEIEDTEPGQKPHSYELQPHRRQMDNCQPDMVTGIVTHDNQVTVNCQQRERHVTQIAQEGEEEEVLLLENQVKRILETHEEGRNGVEHIQKSTTTQTSNNGRVPDQRDSVERNHRDENQRDVLREGRRRRPRLRVSERRRERGWRYRRRYEEDYEAEEEQGVNNEPYRGEEGNIGNLNSAGDHRQLMTRGSKIANNDNDSDNDHQDHRRVLPRPLSTESHLSVSSAAVIRELGDNNNEDETEENNQQPSDIDGTLDGEEVGGRNKEVPFAFHNYVVPMDIEMIEDQEQELWSETEKELEEENAGGTDDDIAEIISDHQYHDPLSYHSTGDSHDLQNDNTTEDDHDTKQAEAMHVVQPSNSDVDDEWESKLYNVPQRREGIPVKRNRGILGTGIGHDVPLSESSVYRAVNLISYGPYLAEWARDKAERTEKVQVGSQLGFLEGGASAVQKEAAFSTGWRNMITSLSYNEIRQEVGVGLALGPYGVNVDRSQNYKATAVEVLARGLEAGTLIDFVDRNFGQRLKVRNFEISVRHDFDDFFFPTDTGLGTEILLGYKGVNAAVATDVREKRVGMTVGIRGYNVAVLHDFDNFLSLGQANWGRGWQLAMESDFPDDYSLSTFVGAGFGKLNRMLGQIGVGVGDDGVPQASARIQTRNVGLGVDFLDEFGQRVFQYALTVGRFTYIWQVNLDLTNIQLPSILGMKPVQLEKLLLSLIPKHEYPANATQFSDPDTTTS